MITISLVIYKNSFEDVSRYIQDLNDCKETFEIIIVDNSPKPLNNSESLNKLSDHISVNYIHSTENLGYGKGHNRSFSEIHPKTSVFICSNLDIKFNLNQVLDGIKQFKHDEIWAISPRFTGSGSNIPRFFPFFGSVLLRIIGRKFGFTKLRNLVERNDLYQNEKRFIPIGSGAFIIIKKESFQLLGGFDHKMWMYVEDWDLSRRIWEKGGRIIYDPSIVVEHKYSTEHNKSWGMKKSLILNLLRFKLKYQFPWDNKRNTIHSFCINTSMDDWLKNLERQSK